MNLNENIKKIKNYKIRKKNSCIYLDSMENNNFNNKKFKYYLFKKIIKKNILFNKYYFINNVKKAENKLLNFLNLKKKKIIIGNGLDEIIFLLCLISKKNIASISPTFSLYEKYSLLLGKKFYKIKLDIKKKIKLKYKKLNKLIYKKKIDLFFLCYPNNPTGSIFNIKEMLNIFENNKNCLFAIDETYYNFYKKSFIKYIYKIRNILILRTFSKIGFASLRIGYIICNKKVYKIINKVKLPYNINIISLISIPYIIKFFKKNFSNIKKQKKKLEFFLKKNNFFYYKSYCNFILLKVKKKLFKKILSNKIIVKKISEVNYKTKKKYIYIRVSIGNKNENKKLIKIFKNEKN
ncbi:aminotransferase class I/II-fold pyridoxal phosphate-dependent enzyme [Candidatus Vidania fulgoroideae]|nr:aminotransferase class I/II-fold pyridoxal phosphate-dependent enzyme [Candidatus Vidania fulgoroideae]WDR79180.1 aminotransferase class I/II-fold pyridoxal phosphate-dependent enzyme [Candidatus Vidania fulgoroideae]